MRYLVIVGCIEVLSTRLYLIQGLRAFFVSGSTSGFLCGAAFGLEFDELFSQR
jgi:2-methylisocitrate lyase-like PEP mutase family enzyme